MRSECSSGPIDRVCEEDHPASGGVALLIGAGIQAPHPALAQGPDESDDRTGPVGVVVDADNAQEGDVLAVGEKLEEGCDFGDQVREIEIVGTPSLPEKAEMHVSIRPTEECELIVAEVLWSASTGASGEGGKPPGGPVPGKAKRMRKGPPAIPA